MARKAVAQELSRERILEEARELFVTRGYRALTMRSIAKAMGYSHGALYYHFREKAELFNALILEDFGILLQRQRQIIVESAVLGVPLLQKLMMEFIRFGLENPHHYEIMFMIRDEELRQYSRTEQAKCFDLFATVVRQVISGMPDKEDQEYRLPWNLFMSMHGFISHSIHYGQTFELVEQLAEEHVQLLCSNMVSTAARSESSKVSLVNHESA
ncbi:TetR/AcrR family transcriptional regulator [Paenibacillus sp. UNC499MF]|uniref:TetR/AcrR family transcriptional regulator n=1 Tax=Paenibacillus sp. UNC499MF TaxID=1502751 RepID=UPI00089FCD8A|nr:TetR/AcrR family transcriptional regulator [Paenibacillus sp. UNC499MF]SEF81489.1 transcriptional regulator, TetR family [Paenibacillus sp. UNC499MF]